MRYRTVRLLEATLLALALASSPAWARPSGFSSGSHHATAPSPAAASPAKAAKQASGFGSGSGSTPTAAKASPLGTTLHSAQASSVAAATYTQAHTVPTVSSPADSARSAPTALGAGGEGPSNGGYTSRYDASRPVVVQQNSNNGLLTGLVVGSLLSHHSASAAAYPPGSRAQSAADSPAPSDTQWNRPAVDAAPSHFWRTLFLILLAVGLLIWVLRMKLAAPSARGDTRQSDATAPKKHYEL